MISSWLRRITFLPEADSYFLAPYGDDYLTPLDDLIVINWINSSSGGGDGDGEYAIDSAMVDFFWLDETFARLKRR